MDTDQNLKDQLRAAYDADARRRTGNADNRSQWKLIARQQFSDRAKAENKQTILEIGAGAGVDAKYFQDQGFDVLATDLSVKMVDECQRLGLEAKTVDLYDLDKLGRQFDAIYSLNVLLHVPPKDIEHVLLTIRDCLKAHGLFFYGVYGGITREETYTDPTRMNLPRYFSFLDDTSLLEVASSVFDVVDSKRIDIGDDQKGLHFQSLLLRKK